MFHRRRRLLLGKSWWAAFRSPVDRVVPVLVLDYAGLEIGQFRADGVNKTFANLHTFTRASVATVRDLNGLLTTSASGAHRLNHDKDGNRLGLQSEKERTNICLQSNDLDTTWVANAATTADMAQSGTGPDGIANSMWKLIDDGGGGNGLVQVTQAVTVATTTTYTWSVFAKEDQLPFLCMRTSGFTTPANSETFFDLNNGVVGTLDAAITSSGIEDYGNGIFRCWIVFTTHAADTSGSLVVRLSDTDESTSVARDNSSSILVFGSVLEIGTFPTSYIPTTTVAVTRAAETCQIATSSFGYAVAAGTYYVSLNLTAGTEDDGLAHSIMRLEIDGNNKQVLQKRSTNQWRWRIDDNSNALCDITAGTPTAGDTKLAVVYATNDFALYADGSSIGTDTSGTPSMTPTPMFIGVSETGTAQLDGHIKVIVYYDSRLSNSDLVAITS